MSDSTARQRSVTEVKPEQPENRRRDESFIAMSWQQIVREYLQERSIEGEQARGIDHVCHQIVSIFQFECCRQLDELKELYEPFNPDAPLVECERNGGSRRTDPVLDTLGKMLLAAHYWPLPQAELHSALSGATYWGLDLHLNRDVFDRLMIYVRGDAQTVKVRRDIGTWFRTQEVDLETYDRMVLAMKLQPQHRLGDEIGHGFIYLKMFRDIPKLDLEMLLPGTRPRMKLLDAAKISSSSLTGLYGLTRTLVLSAMGKFTWFMVTLGALSYAWQSFFGYRRTREQYMSHMTQQLYYQSLDNNLGVFCRIVDEAHDEQAKEVILAYLFLSDSNGSFTTPDELADRVERWLVKKTSRGFRFPVREALMKMSRLGLLAKRDGSLVSLPLAEAQRRLFEHWSGYCAAANPLAE